MGIWISRIPTREERAVRQELADLRVRCADLEQAVRVLQQGIPLKALRQGAPPEIDGDAVLRLVRQAEDRYKRRGA